MTHSMVYPGFTGRSPVAARVPSPRHAQRPPAEQRHAAGYPGEQGPPAAYPGTVPGAGAVPEGGYQPAGPPWAAPTTAHRVIPAEAPEQVMPAAPEPGAGPVVTPSHDLASTDLRGQVVRRLRAMNWHHTDHARERRHRDPIGPHALAFLFAEPPDGDPPRYGLRAATRLFLAGDDVDNLPKLIYDLTAVMAGHLRNGGDVRALTGRQDEMSPLAGYVGVGVSSLDTPAGTWAQVRRRVKGSMEVPGRCYALLTDGTTLLLDRGGENQFGRFDIRANARMDEMRWTYDVFLADADPATQETWQQLADLNRTIEEGMSRAR